MVITIAESTLMACPKDTASTSGRIKAHTREISSKEKEADMESGLPTRIDLKDIVATIAMTRKLAMEFTLGTMDGSIREILITTIAMAMENSMTQKASFSTRDSGKTESSPIVKPFWAKRCPSMLEEENSHAGRCERKARAGMKDTRKTSTGLAKAHMAFR